MCARGRRRNRPQHDDRGCPKPAQHRNGRHDAIDEAAEPELQPVGRLERRPDAGAVLRRVAEPVAKLRRAAIAKPHGKSRAVVQLGAFSSRDRVEVAWNRASSKYAALRGYTPVSARFASANGTVYRLSVKGFDSDSDARLLCESLKRSGRACFVRAVSGDAPVQFASR